MPFIDFDGGKPAGEFIDFDEPSKPSAKPAERNAFAFANDTVIELANAVVGSVAAVGDFISPGNRASSAMKEFQREGEEKQSDVTKAAKQKFRGELEASESIGSDLSTVGGYLKDNPILAASQAVGSFVVPGAAVKGIGGAAKLLGAGAGAAQVAGRAGGIAAGAAMGGGDAGGSAYELTQQIPDEVLKRNKEVQEMLASGMTMEQVRHEIGTIAARKASVLPAVAGGLAGAFGAEKLLAGGAARAGVRGALTAGAVEAGGEAVEEGLSQYEGRRAAQAYDPSIDPTKNVAAMAAMGGAMGFGAGAGLNAISAKPAAPGTVSEPEPDVASTPETLLLENRPDPFISFPDGSVGRQADVDSFINALPEGDRIAARARLYGLAEQDAQTPTVADIQQAESVDDAIAVAAAVVSAPTEFDADLRNQQIDAAFSTYMAEKRQAEFDLAEQARREADVPRMESQVRDERVDLANAITEAQGFDTREPTAMQIAMQEAQARRERFMTPVSQRAAIEAPAPATQATEAIPQEEVANALPAAAAPVRNDGMGSTGSVAQEQSDAAQGLAPVQSPIEVGGNDNASTVGAAVRTGVPDSDGSLGATAALTTGNGTVDPVQGVSAKSEQSTNVVVDQVTVDRAKKILADAKVFGRDRIELVEKIRSGQLRLEDLQDAYPQSASENEDRLQLTGEQKQSTFPPKESGGSVSQPLSSQTDTTQSAQQVESAAAKTDGTQASTPDTSSASQSPVESIESVSPEKAAPVKLEFEGKTFSSTPKAMEFLRLKRVDKDYRIEQTGRDKYELVPAVATKDDKRARIDSREVRLEAEIAKAKANAASRAAAKESSEKPMVDDDAPRYSKSKDDSGKSDRLNRIKNVPESRRLPNIGKSVPASYVPKQASEKTVKVYRAVPEKYEDATIRPGDWIALNKNYAREHGTGETGSNRIIEMEVPAEHVVWAGTDMEEWFYAPPSDQDQVMKSTGPATPSAFTTESILPALDTALKRYGKDFVKNLLATGKVKIVTSKEAAIVLGSQPEGPAFFNPKTGLTYIVADRIGKNATPEQLHGLVLHEVANHALQMGKSSTEFKKLLANLALMEKAGNPKVKAAAARADDAGASSALRMEETAGYLLEGNPDLSISQRFIAWLRAGIRSLGQSLPVLQRAAWFKSIDTMSVNDLVYAAQNVLQGAPSALADQTEEQAQGEPAFTKPAGRTIEVDGVRRPITNSNGKPVAETFEKQMAFWKWFGSSTVVDPSGKPIVVYHGANQDFTVFDQKVRHLGDGDVNPQGVHFFSPEQAVANAFSRSREKISGGERTVMPVYIRLENPIDLRTMDAVQSILDEVGIAAPPKMRATQAYALLDNAKVVEYLKKQGYDGALLVEPGGSFADYRNALDLNSKAETVSDFSHTRNFDAQTIAVFSPNQIKSATGNDGSFSPDTSDIRYSKSVRTGTEWVADSPTRLDDFLYAVQDKQIDTKRTVQAITKAAGRIADELDPRLQETLFSGRSAKATQDFAVKELKPLYIDMQARGVTMDELQEYLHARHAKERNAQIASINPKMPDGGSGMKNADADKYMNGLSQAKRASYTALAKRVDAINAETQKLLVDAGLEKQSTVDAWNSAYKHYVPLQRAEVGEGMAGIGQGFSVRGASTRRAMGSDKEVIDILANVAMQRERAILRAEKNKVSTAVFGLAIDQPNSDFWLPVNPNKIAGMTPKAYREMEMELIELGLNPADAASVMKEPKQRYVDPRTGMVSERINPALRSAPNVLALRVNGEDRFVFFSEKDVRAQRMVTALKNLDAEQLGVVLGAAAKVSRWFASVNTQYNPVFGIVNVTRDVQGAMMNISTTEIAGKQKAVMGHTMSALRGIYADVRAKRAGRHPISPWAQLYEEFQKEGGQTGFRDMFADSGDRARALQSEIDQITEGKLKGAGRAIFGWLSDYNETLENAVRLAAYKVATDQGISKQRAAALAKELTVNFNRKGTMALQAGALYAFFNASVQGTTRLAETLRGPAGKKIIAGGLLLGVMQAMLFAAAGFDDGEPPEFVKERSIVIPTGNGKYIAIPMPLGFHVVPSFSRIITEWAMSGGKNTAKRTADIFGLFASSFNPIGSAGMSIQSIAPTAVDPLVALSENRDFTGKQIAREDMSGLRKTPGYLRTKDTASELSKTLSYYLNLASGGTKYQAGVASPTPDQIDYLIGQVTGGVGRETMKLEQAVVSTVTGEDLAPNKIPVVGRFYGDTQGNSAESSKFYDNIRRMNSHKLELDGRRENGENVAEYIRENRDAVLSTMAVRVQSEVSKLTKIKRELVESGASRERVKLIEMKIASMMKQLNDRAEALREKASAD